MAKRRRAAAAEDRTAVRKAVGSEALEDGGKKSPAQISGSGLLEDELRAKMPKAARALFEHVGFFFPLPAKLAGQYPAEGRKSEDESPVHLTLLYLGEMKPEKEKALLEAAKKVFAETAPLRLSLGPVDDFQNKDGQTIRHSPVTGKGLQQLHTRLAKAVEEAGVESASDYKNYKP